MYFPHREFGQRFLSALSSMSKKRKIDVYFIDGNHEDHMSLAGFTAQHGHDNPICIQDRLFYIPRGCRFQIDDITFLGYGGAYSINRKELEHGISWFSQETVDYHHLAALPDEHVDVLITHEVPDAHLDWYGDPYCNPSQLECHWQREYLALLVDKLTPELIFCGHHHRRDVFRLEHRQGTAWGHCLDKNGRQTQSWHILDLLNLHASKG